MELKSLIIEAHDTAKEKGFWDIKDSEVIDALKYLNDLRTKMFEDGITNEEIDTNFKWSIDIVEDKLKNRNVGELLMLINTELAEALEAYRKNIRGFNKDSFEEEIADTFIRLFDLCGGLKINIEEHILNKMDYNKKRERLHGKKF